jgi:GMP synthase-like glutamine amidotransferase
MKVGLLECDHVREDLLHIDGDYRQMFPSLFAGAAPDWDFVFYDVCNGQFPASADDCDVYICTGSRFSVYDEEDWVIRLKQFVNEIYHSGKIYLGVCFGHQMLAEALGGKVEKSPIGWCVGVHTFDIVENEAWMNPSMPSLNLLMMCQDQVAVLPPGSTVLATGPSCPIAMFRVGSNMLAVQAHPEFSKAYDQALMELRIERIGQPKVQEGIASLDLPVYGSIMAGWMKNFAEAMKN